MISFTLALVLMFVALMAIAIRKTYHFVPIKELKRQARHGDQLAEALYRAVAYGASLDLLLWVIVALSLAGSFVLLEKLVPGLIAFILEALVIGVGFAWIPTSDLTKAGARLVVWTTPLIVWLLNALQPVLGRIVTFVHAHRKVTVHTGLYEREDLLRLLAGQREQPDSRISHEELDLLMHSLTFGDKTVYDCMVPRREVRTISADEQVGPIIIRELHESGYARFPVFDDKKDNIVGTLYLREIINLKQSGAVRSIMEPKVYYVHEDYSLEQVLHAFLKTKHHLFIVVDKFEQFVGIITIEDILEQILGCKIVDEFESYENRRAVAEHQASREHAAHKKAGEEPVQAPDPKKVSDGPTEVVQ